MSIPSFRQSMLLPAGVCALALLASGSMVAQTNCHEKNLYDRLPKQSLTSSSAASSNSVQFAAGEESAYKVFSKLKPQDTDKRIQTGSAFIRKYPSSSFAEAVYSQLSLAEYQKQDFAEMERYADKALALNPNDVTVLVLTGWVIPHSSDISAARLDKAEGYEKHALDLLPTLPKPAGMTDQQMADAKAQYESQAHSGLGLVYYRRNNFAGAVSELRAATSGASSPDPTDYSVLGSSLASLSSFSDAAKAFKVCAGIAGAEQARCKQEGELAKKEAALEPHSSQAVATVQASGQSASASQ